MKTYEYTKTQRGFVLVLALGIVGATLREQRISLFGGHVVAGSGDGVL